MQGHTKAQRWKPDRFTITVPDNWFALDTQAARSSVAISRMAAARVRDHPRLAGQGSSVARILREAAAYADRRGAVYCAVMIEEVRGAGLSACLTVCLHSAQDDPDLRRSSRHGRDLGRPARDLLRHGRVVPYLPSRRWWRRVGFVDLPAAGRAVRTCAFEQQRPMDGGPAAIRLVMRTTVPIPGLDRVAVISCASPNTGLAPALHGLFEEVTATFRFIHDPQLPELEL
ncbi:MULTISPECIES: hypothetical protein [unclassified Parafrankia]|uniref:hypothetical protein n=1 Tax=unclassified Parafrankia TaxID=2994368 RepID=UPI000DA42A6A|nr:MULTISPECIES: hypothetical protein [unclassified Parafrankia]TCJ34081.1 hypothetical protein E0504_34840 [Parafrankia sp. BMG5.11]SQD94070.1 conserved hypothetical protein [Parafrankia sp. Ea1.12]